MAGVRPAAALAGRALRAAAAPGAAETYHVRIETWPQDQRSIWLENTGSFPTPTPVAEASRFAAQLDATYRFLCGPVCGFLGTLDTP